MMKKWIMTIGVVLTLFAAAVIMTAICREQLRAFLAYVIYCVVGVVLYWFCPSFTYWSRIFGKTKDAYYTTSEGRVKLFAIALTILTGIRILLG